MLTTQEHKAFAAALLTPTSMVMDLRAVPGFYKVESLSELSPELVDQLL